MPTQIVPESIQRLHSVFDNTQREFADSPDMVPIAFDETVTQLSGIDASSLSRAEYIRAQSVYTTLGQVLVAWATRAGGFNGNT